MSIADDLLAAFEGGALVKGWPDLDEPGAYAVLEELRRRREAMGWTRIGRKIGFTNRTIWELYGVDRAFYADLWDRTVVYADADNAATFALGRLQQPRIEPEVAFKLKSALPATDSAEEVLSHVEWMAPAFEIVQCPYDGWKFTSFECTAAFGLHGGLVVGAPVEPASADALASFTLVLSRDGAEVDRGVGSNVLDSPALALAHLSTLVQVSAGEIVTTGTITNAHAVAPGQTWSSDYGDLGVVGLTLTFE